MARILKSGISPTDAAEIDARTRQTVETILTEIRSRGDAAVREYSEKFDAWTPKAFRVAPENIHACYQTLSDQTLEDIAFAQAQVRRFAEAQRQALQDLEIETLPGIVLGHKNIPVGSVGCYMPGGKYPLVACAHMSVVTAKVAGVPRVIAAAPPFKGALSPAIIVALDMAGADEIYSLGGVQAIGAMGYGTETVRPVDMLVGPGNAYVAEA